MHQFIYNFFQSLETTYPVDIHRQEYLTGKPVSQLIIDNFLPNEVYQEILNELDNYPEEMWAIKNLPSSGIRKESKNFNATPLLRTVANSFTSDLFVSWMKKITNNDQIIPDVEFLGAGLASAPQGSYLGLHVDFNWNNTLKLNRKFNLLFYLNKEWKEEWGGELEIWNFEKTKLESKILPMPNRLIFWEHDERLVHGYPTPIKSPSGVERQNLMVLYYTSNGSPEAEPHKSIFYN